ncbi:hypothetical protein AX777_10760 [Sphingobium yanoikuyae]|uniref:Uncharacterized protein n=1 Tax=Sphingobium yanoikuyae TaxID=13690 RepID=A0A177JSA8_SPHYA|nr:hypothetical protein AYR46_13615 [Sphingobium yanoikuyae]OAH43301.1 hypothetical protein AX777_10760 [Sphingobium yanoikuyae]PHP18918.1 hypothetical protein CG471_14930 [Sphingobium sp. IP1]RSU74323.1 hypothetical protein BRX37_13755 [Sphingomonas sp. S-NIH.Pt3_0716]
MLSFLQNSLSGMTNWQIALQHVQEYIRDMLKKNLKFDQLYLGKQYFHLKLIPKKIKIHF